MSEPESKLEDHVEDHLNAADAEMHKRLTQDHFEYDIDLNDEHSHASAAQLALLEKRNKKLLDLMEELEDRLFDSEELRSTSQRKLALVEKEADDYKSLLQKREADHSRLSQELSQLNSNLQEKSNVRSEAEALRRQLEHSIAILQTEAEQNERAQAKADKANDEVERLRRRIGEIIDQKASKASQLTSLDKKKKRNLKKN